MCIVANMRKGIVWDMNGVIINDERIHQESWRRLCREHGFTLSEDEFTDKVFGRTEKDTLEYLLDKILSEDELDSWSNVRVDIACEIAKRTISGPPEGLMALLDEAKALDMKMAIATSSRQRYFQYVMELFGIRGYFDAVVTAQDITHSKPHPEIYQKALGLIGLEGGECFAIEDSVSGIRSAQAAGLWVVGLASTHKPEELKLADSVVSSLSEIEPDKI